MSKLTDKIASEIATSKAINTNFNRILVGIKWKDGDYDEIDISLVPKDTDTESLDYDDEITFYITEVDELLDLCSPTNKIADFYITEYFYSYAE